jgi:hypothetical protein
MKETIEPTEQDRKKISLAASMLGTLGGRIGGKASTPAKRRAARQNGKLGGRPRKRASELTPAGRYQRAKRERLRKSQAKGEQP